MAETIKIGGELESVATGGKVTDVVNIKDKTQGDKSQAQINAELRSAVGGLNGENYVNLTATDTDTDIATVFTREGVTPAVNTIYRIANWKADAEAPATKYNTAYYSEYAASGTTTDTLVPISVVNNGIDDVPTAGSNNLAKSGGVKSYVDGNIFNQVQVASINTEQVGWHTSEMLFQLKARKTHILSLQLTGFNQASNYIIYFYTASGSANRFDATSLFGGSEKVTSGELIQIEYTPEADIVYVEFRYSSSGYSAPEGNNISMIGKELVEKYAKKDDFDQLAEDTEVATDLTDVNGELYYKGSPISMGGLSAVVTDLPVSDGTDIESGYAYIDITDRTIKVKS